MKLLLESWRQYIAEEQRVDEGLMDRVKSKLQRMAGIENVSGKINPYPEGEGYWMDIAVPYSDADVKNLSDDTLLAAAVIDKLAEEMGFKEPVVTSGYRDNHRKQMQCITRVLIISDKIVQEYYIVYNVLFIFTIYTSINQS